MTTNINKDIRKITNSVLNTVISVLNKANVETTKSESKKFPVTVNNTAISVSLPEYYLYVDKGRKSGGKRPPIKPILDWIKREKITVPKEIPLLSFAFAVANSIAEEGIKARPFIEVLYDQIGELVRTYLITTMNNQISKL